jgi:hypothetical protein
MNTPWYCTFKEPFSLQTILIYILFRIKLIMYKTQLGNDFTYKSLTCQSV